MKKLLLILCVLGIVFVSCKKDKDEDGKPNPTPTPPAQTLQPKQEQWGFAINYTAKWCGPCGSWGAPLMKNLAEMNSGKVVAIAPHTSNDPMYVAAIYNGFTADRKTGGGVPSFWVGDEKVSSSTATNKMTALIGKTPIAGIDMKTTKKTDKFEVKAKVKFFSAGSGDYFLSFYILEDGIPGGSGTGQYQQSGTSDANYKHNYVPRKSYTTQIYGELLSNNPAANATFDKEFDFAFDTQWNNTLYVAAALWHFNPNGNPNNNIPKYEFINGFVAK